MARADTVSLTYTAEIADLKKKLAEIPGATGKEAKKAVAEVSKAVKLVAKAEAEAKKAAEGSAGFACICSPPANRRALSG